MRNRKSAKYVDTFDSWKDFVKPLLLDVTGVYVYTSPINTVIKEGPVGGHSDSELTGYETHTMLDVKRTFTSKAGELKRLKYNGVLPLSVDDRIRAYVVAAKMSVSREFSDYDSEYSFERRRLKTEERAFKIEKIDKMGRLAATYETVVTPEYFHE